MPLEEKLAAIREMAKTRQPPEVRASGIMDRVVKIGAHAPDFTLPNVDGQPVSLAALRARGPVVLSFYRGRW